MNKEEIFSVWAPEGSPWSNWAKPVLFAHMDAVLTSMSRSESAVDVNWFPPADGKVAFVLDLPGAEGVHVGVALAGRGYRPVPLYNAVPLPTVMRILDFGASLQPVTIAAVDVTPIVMELRAETEQLAQGNLPLNAPPVFLLDANRQGDGRTMTPGQFDNRSVCFTTDFPSANFLHVQGIERVILVQRERTEPLRDLAHALRRWQDGGLVIERIRIDAPAEPERFEVRKPWWFGMMFQRALMAFGLRRSFGGGFGAWVPNPSSG
jgi:hypothetical protein